ncbi:MAG: NADP oxidoreductase coenzyme F420-dependent [Sphingobacteriales bacterium]|nr:MAG: NADP oxidoreductase coenzyme F420-dependent [Sphingobacteriales bacterium]
MSQTLKVAIIGVGNIGTAVAANLVKGSRSVIIADRTFEKAQTLAQKLGPLAKPALVPEAVKEADIIILAIYFDPIKAFLKEFASELEGKIIVDPSNPIAPAEGGGFKKIIAENESAGQILSTQLPNRVRMVKALGSLGAGSLAEAAHQTVKAVLFYATDDTSLNTAVEQLITDTGFDPVRIGGLDQSIRIEVFGDLHEFGALAKTVTRAEAEEKV